MLFTVLARKAYLGNLQYRGSHMVQNLASSIFGFIYVSIWIGIGEGRELGDYGVTGMVSYVAFNQAVLWVTLFLGSGLGIPESVRTGQIVLDLLRPVHLFYLVMSREWGRILYQFIYKSLPIYLLYFFVFSLQLPSRPVTCVWTLMSLIAAAYLSICLGYLIGIAALWTTESTWFYWLNYSFTMLLSGFFIPVEWLPGWLRFLSLHSPYPYLQYYPVKIYLEHETFRVLAGSVFWCVLLTLICVGTTALARRRVEVQGG